MLAYMLHMEQAWETFMKWLMDALGLSYNCKHAWTYVTHGTSMGGIYEMVGRCTFYFFII